MERSVGRVAVAEVGVDRQKVNVVHGDVVAWAVLAEQKANVDQSGAIKSAPMDVNDFMYLLIK